MKLGRKDLKRLRLPSAGCLALILAGAACYFAADGYLQETKKLAAATSAQRAEVQARLASANEEEREIKASLQQYQTLAARGIVGEERRLDFIDALARRGKSYLSVRSCDVQRESRVGGTTLAPRLQADCVFDLITIRHG